MSRSYYQAAAIFGTRRCPDPKLLEYHGFLGVDGWTSFALFAKPGTGKVSEAAPFLRASCERCGSGSQWGQPSSAPPVWGGHSCPPLLTLILRRITWGKRVPHPFSRFLRKGGGLLVWRGRPRPQLLTLLFSFPFGELRGTPTPLEPHESLPSQS